MIGNNMRNFKMRIAQMKRKTEQAIYILAAVLLTGCTSTDNYNSGDAAEAEFMEELIIAEPAGFTENGYTNYRHGAADYREFGERTPHDKNIVTNGGASNMSASIPPTIEEEVMDYEDEINAAQTESDADSETSNMAAGEDMVEDWLAEEGSTLKGLLTDWSERAGWRLIWNSNRNYTLSAGAMFRGRFADVSSALIRSFARARPAPVATFYKGNRGLVVETMEDENAYN